MENFGNFPCEATEKRGRYLGTYTGIYTGCFCSYIGTDIQVVRQRSYRQKRERPWVPILLEK